MKLSKLKSMTPAAKERRITVIKELEKQLKDGTKPNNPKIREDGQTLTKMKMDNPIIPLTAKDIERKQKEIAVLKTRI